MADKLSWKQRSCWKRVAEAEFGSQVQSQHPGGCLIWGSSGQVGTNTINYVRSITEDVLSRINVSQVIKIKVRDDLSRHFAE